MNLFQIFAPRFTAGFCVDAKGTVWQAAPIIKWMRDKPLGFVASYCKSKGWTLVSVDEDERDGYKRF